MKFTFECPRTLTTKSSKLKTETTLSCLFSVLGVEVQFPE